MLSCRYCFHCWVCHAVLRLLSTILNFSLHFYCHVIFIAAVQFVTVLPAIITAFHSRLDLSFVELPFCSVPVIAIFILLLKTFSLCYRSPPHLLALVVVVLLAIFMPSCCSYYHCSTGSNSHTVVLSKPLSSIVLYLRKKT